ncbi:MAG: DUF2794 domain-containing protein [Candidatus Puniceispirillaceae bacterium]
MINNGLTQRRKDRPFYFSKPEFTAIIAAYSLRVATAEWRDYALDHTPKAAFFSIFKSSHETPIFVIEKHRPQGKDDTLFVLRDRKRILTRSSKLQRILDHFDRLPTLVKS